jgi:hypothetical protein
LLLLGSRGGAEMPDGAQPSERALGNAQSQPPIGCDSRRVGGNSHKGPRRCFVLGSRASLS